MNYIRQTFRVLLVNDESLCSDSIAIDLHVVSAMLKLILVLMHAGTYL